MTQENIYGPTAHELQETQAAVLENSKNDTRDQPINNDAARRLPPLTMACENPIPGYRATDGGPILFTKPTKSAWVRIDVPCGICILCRQEHARQWAVRITHEASLHEENCFITLTYSQDKEPKDGNLDYAELQRFWKRLRKAIKQPLRYYAVGEYGDKTKRPHYHACIFGLAFLENRTILRTEPTLLWTHPTLEKAWGNGYVSVGALNFQTAQYTASYVTKKLGKSTRYVRLDVETGELIDMIQPRAFCSRDPAIAEGWLEKHGNQVYAFDQVVINGTPQKPPKMYDRWLKKRSKIAEQMIKEERQKKATKVSREELRARAINARARMRMKTKKV